MVCVNVILYNYRSLFLTCSGSELIPDLCEHILRIINSNLKTPFYATFLCTNIFVKEEKIYLTPRMKMLTTAFMTIGASFFWIKLCS